VAMHGDVEDIGYEDFEWIMDIDFWGVVHGSKTFLPHLISSGDGRLVNVSSLFGLMAVPGQSAYNSAKFAVRGFTEALRQEMLLNGRPVKVTCVHPGGVKTAIARSARAVGVDQRTHAELFDRHLARTTPDSAAKDDPGRHGEGQAPSARGPRREGVGPPGTRARLWLPTARRGRRRQEHAAARPLTSAVPSSPTAPCVRPWTG
jgi:NAD(P)-dependent dehydrogenase (short-subunit alcohol dehydrogenase family)